ncbi:MAG: hypothetical protein ACYSWU_04435, partial [Planctomycetota bacterium]
MPKFVLIDPSVQDFQGHYCEYAMRVLKSAEARGYLPVLAANRRFRASDAVDAKVCPVYRYAFWFASTDEGLLRWLRNRVRAVERRWTRLKVRLSFSRLGLLWILRRQPREYLQRKTLTARSALPVFLLLMASYLVRVGKAGLRLLWGAMPFHGYMRRMVSNFRRFVGVCALPTRHVLDVSGPVMQSVWMRLKMRQFTRDTRRLFQKVPLEPGDVVFLSLTSATELTAVARYFRKSPTSNRASWHLLFRHQLYSAEEGGPYSETNRPLRSAFYNFQQALGGQQVHFYTDTDDLTAQYNSLGILDFRTLPIPVSDEYHTLRHTSDRTGPLQIVYVGDARVEKGYHYLPRIVDDLWAKYVVPGTARFVIQSNFSVPEGSPETVIARAQLQIRPHDKVQLISEPLLPRAYRDLVLDSDLVLLLYDTTAYYAGSSGILAEALAAGRPVIVPEGTWMGNQIVEASQSHMEQLSQRLRRVAAHDRWSMRLGSEDLGEQSTSERSLSVGGGPHGCRAALPVPDSADFLLVSVGPSDHQTRSPVRLDIEESDDCKQVLRQRALYLRPVVGASRRYLFPLAPGSRVARLELSRDGANSPAELTDLQFEFLSRRSPQQPCPLGAVGQVYRDPDEVSELLR